MQRFTITKNDADQRLDKYISKKFPSMPSSMLYKGIRKKWIKLNGKRTEPSTKLTAGDVLECYLKDEFLVPKAKKEPCTSLIPQLQILYEDENILLIDKAPGISIHPDETESENTLVNHLMAYLYQKKEYDPASEDTFVPAFCNRIDKNTGGIVIAAKNAMALRTINQKIRDREISKQYLCLVHGRPQPPEGVLTGYHQKDPRQNKAIIFDQPRPGARQIRTKYRVLGTKKGLSLVEVELLTGRFHQIRAQFAHIGHPLAGDTKYGSMAQNKGLPFRYQALYSYRIKFNFTTPSELDYLKGREFTASKVPFAKTFYS